MLVCHERRKSQLSFPLFVINNHGMASKISHHCCAKTVFCLATKCSNIQLMVSFYDSVNSSADWNQGGNPPVLSFICM